MKSEHYSWPPRDAGQGSSNPFGASEATNQPATFSGTNTFAFPAAGGGRGVAASSGTSCTDNMSVEQIQAQTEKHATAIAESEQRMLRMAAATHESGANTLNQLHSAHHWPVTQMSNSLFAHVLAPEQCV